MNKKFLFHFPNDIKELMRLAARIREKTGLRLSPGDVYRGDGKRFLRMNLACPRSQMLDGLSRLRRALGD